MTSKVFQFNLDKLICTDAYYDFVKRTIGLKLESRIGVKGMNMKGIVDINNSPVWNQVTQTPATCHKLERVNPS